MYGSHNSLTGYKPKRWWGWFLLPFARCQRAAVGQQMENGARVFDLRVRFDRFGNLEPCHGLVTFKADVQGVVSRLETSGCYYRVVLENRLGGHSVKDGDLERLKSMFLNKEHRCCLYVSDKRNWNTSYNKYCGRRYWEKNMHAGTWGIIPILWLWKYRKLREYHSMNVNTHTIYWYDFV